MTKYTRKDIIFFGDDPRSENAMGKKVFGGDSPTDLLFLANECDPDLYCETLTIVRKYADSRPFSTYVEGPLFTGYNHYDVIIVKKEEE